MNWESSQEARDALGELSNKLNISNSYKLNICDRPCFLQVLFPDKKKKKKNFGMLCFPLLHCLLSVLYPVKGRRYLYNLNRLLL